MPPRRGELFGCQGILRGGQNAMFTILGNRTGSSTPMAEGAYFRNDILTGYHACSTCHTMYKVPLRDEADLISRGRRNSIRGNTEIPVIYTWNDMNHCLCSLLHASHLEGGPAKRIWVLHRTCKKNVVVRSPAVHQPHMNTP